VERGDLPIVKALLSLGASSSGADYAFDMDSTITKDQTKELRADVVAWAASTIRAHHVFRATVLFGCRANNDDTAPPPISVLGGHANVLQTIAQVRIRDA